MSFDTNQRLLVAAARFIINRDELTSNLALNNFKNSFSNSSSCFSKSDLTSSLFMPVDQADASSDQEPLSKFKYKVLI